MEKKSIIFYKSIISLENLKISLINAKINQSFNIQLDKLHNELKIQSYQPNKLKKVLFLKLKNNLTSLYIFSRSDRIVQTAILNIMEPFCEKIFIKNIYGFKNDKSFNDVLKNIKYNWKNISWIMKIDLKKYFCNINFNVILQSLSNYCDQATVELIRKFYNADYLNIIELAGNNVQYKTENVFLSLILVNLYLTFFDNYVVNEFKTIYTENKRNKFFLLDCMKKIFKRFYYIRYIDIFIIGFIGTWQDIITIYSKINKKLKIFNFDLSSIKISIYKNNKKSITFLGFFFNSFSYNQIWLKKNYKNFKVKNLKNWMFLLNVRFKITKQILIKKLIEKGFLKKTRNSFRSTAVLKYSVFEEDIIVKKFSFLIKSFINYYCWIYKKGDLWKILYFLKKSCALTLAHKCKLSSAAKVFKKYGNNLSVKTKSNVVQLVYPTYLIKIFKK